MISQQQLDRIMKARFGCEPIHGEQIWPEPIWPLHVPKGSDWPAIHTGHIRDYTKNPFTEPHLRYYESGRIELAMHGLLI